MIPIELIMAGVGAVVLAVVVVLGVGQWRARLRLRRLHGDVERLADGLRTPEERAALVRRREAIEDQQRRVHGRFED